MHGGHAIKLRYYQSRKARLRDEACLLRSVFMKSRASPKLLFTYEHRNMMGVFIGLEELLERIKCKGWSVECLAWRTVDVEGDGEHKLEPNLDPNCDVDVEDNSSLTRIFSPLISVIWVTIESGSPSMLNVESRSGEDGERLLVGVAHLLFGGVKVS